MSCSVLVCNVHASLKYCSLGQRILGQFVLKNIYFEVLPKVSDISGNISRLVCRLDLSFLSLLRPKCVHLHSSRNENTKWIRRTLRSRTYRLCFMWYFGVQILQRFLPGWPDSKTGPELMLSWAQDHKENIAKCDCNVGSKTQTLYLELFYTAKTLRTCSSVGHWAHGEIEVYKEIPTFGSNTWCKILHS